MPNQPNLHNALAFVDIRMPPGWDGIETNRDIFHILVIDDNPDIHADFHKILSRPHREMEFTELKSQLFNDQAEDTLPLFDIKSAYQGQEAVALIHDALAQQKPFALAFVDIRMPSGWDGVETIKHLWEADPNLQIVICTAYSDYSWESTVKHLGHTNNFLIIKKPFDKEVICQVAYALTEKWLLDKKVKAYVNYLEETNKAKQAALNFSLSECNRLQVQAIANDKLAGIGILTAGIIHEINNPLFLVLMNLEYVKQKFASLGELDEVIDQIIEAAKRINVIVQDLKGFSRMETAPELTNIHEVIRSAITISTPQFKHRAKLEKNLSPHIPLLLLNKGKMGQILLNLLINAAQSFVEDDLQKNFIYVSTYLANDDVFIEIRDNGAGISPDVLPKIFDPFFTTKSAGMGTGLGLSICSDLIHEMGGEITVTSTVGEGSSFLLHFRKC